MLVGVHGAGWVGDLGLLRAYGRHFVVTVKASIRGTAV
jgi:hypothetical protein